MFAIAAINDTDSRGQWEPLAPTKEAQEFHLTQTYHEGLLKLQSKEYNKARELLENVLKDPLLSSSQVDSTASDGHLLQLRFLTLKNLAAVFLEQGPDHYENALHSYLQAVEIDNKDSVVWNQLGSLSCSMGLLSTSRWAFEQGLICSPNNWNCMEKLLEILIAIGDEVACLSVAELILRHWPSHSRALYVKSVIEESEPVPFAPRGIDKLEPKHARLKFGEKRKSTSDNGGEKIVSKRLNQNLELPLTEASWAALADAIMSILRPLSGCSSEQWAEKCHRSGDCKVAVILPPCYQNGVKHAETKENFLTAVGGSASNGSCNAGNASTINKKEAHMFEEQTHERRSGRLERLRSHKPQKEESDFSGSKDVAKVVIKFLEPFILDAEENKGLGHSDGHLDNGGRSSDNECHDVINFVKRTSKNFGAYHLGHLLLEEVARRVPLHHHAFAIFLELEKLTRNWVCERSIECSLFLAELYYDSGSCSSDASRLSEFMSEVSYHLCKIIESVTLSYPSNYSYISEGEGCSLIDGSHCTRKTSADLHDQIKSPFNASILTERASFWVRFYWLSGHVSVWDGNRAKAHEEFCVSLSLLEDNKNLNDKPGLLPLPHCRVSKELSVDRILHQINLLEVHLLMKETVGRMMERELYLECIDLLSPLLLSCKDAHPDLLYTTDYDGGAKSVELAALDVLIKACESVKPLNVQVYLKCHHRKLQLVMMAARMGDVVVSCKQLSMQSLQKEIDSEGDSRECLNQQHLILVAGEIKAISECASVVKSCVDHYRASNNVTVPTSIVGDIQSLLMAVMCSIARLYLCRKPSCLMSEGHTEQKQKSCFVDAAIGFCKLQHLNLALPIRTRVELITAIHDLLAEYGLCCADEDGEGVDGTFLKVAIKHLLALHMRLKSNCHSSNEGPETGVPEGHIVPMQTSSGVLNEEMVNDASLSSSSVEKVAPEGVCSAKEMPLDDVATSGKQCSDLLDSKLSSKEQPSKQFDHGIELIEEEREDLESTIDNALDQCFFCLYGLNLRSDASYEDDLAVHKNASRAEYQTKEQCADVFKYILPYAKGSTKTGLVKLRRVLRAIKKHFPQPPEDVLVSNPINKFLDDPNLCEDKLSEEAGSDGFLESILKVVFPDSGILKQSKITAESCEPYLEVYSNLYYLLAQSEETSATDKWPGFVLTKEGEEFVEQCANLFKYDLLFNPLRFESWQRLANLYDEEVDLLLNDGSKHINVSGWRKNATLPQRVEISRRRSRRCLLMSLALAKTAEQQCEMHELLALVYYDGLQNVVPLYDQRAVAPSKDEQWRIFCENSLKHFKRAFAHKQDWSHAYYMGKLCEKLGYSPETSLSYYSKAITLNPTAVDPVYRMHASRLKLLYACPRDNIEALKVCAAYCFDESTKETIINLLGRGCLEKPQLVENNEEGGEKNLEESLQLENLWNTLYGDCLSAFVICVEGDLKHFHKARHMLAQGLYRSGKSGDLEKAKDELSFCFKSSRSSFTVNMWEIDGMVRKGRRKTLGVSGNKKALEVNLPESSRKFITCIRKYLLFYLQLLEKTGDISTLDRAYVSIRADKRFSLCLEDLVPVALWRYLKALISSMRSTENSATVAGRSSSKQVLEKVFSLFMEQGSLWPEICAMPEIKGSDLTESMLYGYLHHHLYSLETSAKLDTLEGINEKIRKRFKNPKLSNSSCARVCRHASIAWSRSLIINLVLITSVDSKTFSEVLVNDPSECNMENNQLLCVDLQTGEFWSSLFGDPAQEANLQRKWNPLLSRVNNVIVKRAAVEHIEAANSLLRSAYCFYRDSSSAVLNSGVNMCIVPARLAAAGPLQNGIEGTLETIDVSIPRKLLLWAYTLLHGHYTNMSAVVKYCEENAKSKIKRGSGSSSTATIAPVAPTAHAQPVAAGNKDDASKNGGGSEPASAPLTTTAISPPKACETGLASTTTKVASNHGGMDDPGSAPPTRGVVSSTLPKDSKLCDLNVMPCSGEGQRVLSSTPQLHQCNNTERTTFDLNEDCENLDRS